MIIFLGNGRSVEAYKHIVDESKGDRDIVVSCQYPFLVPKSCVDHFTCVNIHYGLLPYFAGCNPIYWQMVKSDSVGVTLHYMDENFDSGDIIETFCFPHHGMTADECYENCEKIGVSLFTRHYKSILEGTAHRKKQDKTKRVYYKKSMADFNNTCVLNADMGVGFGEMCKKELRALHFKGKQFPTVKLDGRLFELRAK